MTGNADAIPLLQEVASAANAPQLRGEAMTAMVLLGPPGEASLRDVLVDASVLGQSRHAAASALRGRADAKSVGVLTRTLADGNAPLEQRRFAAFALGGGAS